MGKTFELRRSEERDGRGRTQPMSMQELTRLMLRLAPDRNRCAAASGRLCKHTNTAPAAAEAALVQPVSQFC